MAEDREVVTRCLTGDIAAWGELLNAHQRKIYNLCYRFTGSVTDAEDLTQEIFIKVYQTLRSFDAAQAQFATWLNRVARNHLVDHYRRTRHDRANPSLDDEDENFQPRAAPASDAAASLEERERKELLQAALNRLSPEMREVLILRDLQELEYAEIVAVLGIPEGTVKSRINRGRMELGRVLKRMLKSERFG